MTRPLTGKQERYCQLAAFNSYADAYRDAYDCDQGAIIGPAISTLNRDARITLRISQIQAEAAKPLGVDREWLLRWHFHRMTYNPAEITAWAVGACHFCYGDGHQYQWRAPEFMRELALAEASKEPLPDIAGGFGYDIRRPPHADCPNCNGQGNGRPDLKDTSSLSPSARAAFDGLKVTKDGVEIKMADKADAAKQFAKLSGLDVIQVRSFTDAIPSGEELERLRRDPNAAAAAYKAIVAGGKSNVVPFPSAA